MNCMASGPALLEKLQNACTLCNKRFTCKISVIYYIISTSPPLPSTTANGMRQWATSCDSKHFFVSDNFHTFANVTFVSHIFATSLARGFRLEFAHDYREICEAIAWYSYMCNKFGILTCILVRLWNCVVGA